MFLLWLDSDSAALNSDLCLICLAELLGSTSVLGSADCPQAKVRGAPQVCSCSQYSQLTVLLTVRSLIRVAPYTFPSFIVIYNKVQT